MKANFGLRHEIAKVPPAGRYFALLSNCSQKFLEAIISWNGTALAEKSLPGYRQSTGAGSDQGGREVTLRTT